MRSIYLDYQSGAPPRPEVRAAMAPFLAERFAGAGSLHHLGIEAREALALARQQTAALVNAERPECVIFTSDGTEAANLAVKGMAWARRGRGRHIIVTEAEHPAVMESASFLEKQGWTCSRISVNGEGVFDPRAVEAAITPETTLIAIHLVNHDLGTVQPARETAEIAQARGIPLFVDAEAAVGWMPVDVQALGADLLSFSPWRFYGPRGVGALYCRRGTRPENLIHGGAQEEGRRAGAENLAGIAGAGAAAVIAVRELPARETRTRNLQCRLWERLKQAAPLLKLNGPAPGPGRIGTNLNFSAEFTEGEGLVLMLDAQGIQVASGSACLGKSVRVPPVLKAIGLPASLAMANVIVSLGMETTTDEVDAFVDAYRRAVERLRGMSPAWEDYQAGRVKSALGGAC